MVGLFEGRGSKFWQVHLIRGHVELHVDQSGLQFRLSHEKVSHSFGEGLETALFACDALQLGCVQLEQVLLNFEHDARLQVEKVVIARHGTVYDQPIILLSHQSGQMQEILGVPNRIAHQEELAVNGCRQRDSASE